MRITRPDYGIDAPGIRRGMAAAGLGGAALAAVAMTVAIESAGAASIAAGILAACSVLVAAYGSGMAAYMTWSSRVGKLRTRDRLLERAGGVRPWTGREAVLDVGCGRGLMLIGAARRLTSGRAIGVDLWRDQDQAGNSSEATWANARLEGVADPIAIETGDACALPFVDESFDAVLSHWVVHNIPEPADRARAIDEMMRVLRPGGVFVLADIAHHEAYRQRLTGCHAVVHMAEPAGLDAKIMGVLSGGTFQPQSIVALKPAP